MRIHIPDPFAPLHTNEVEKSRLSASSLARWSRPEEDNADHKTLSCFRAPVPRSWPRGQRAENNNQQNAALLFTCREWDANGKLCVTAFLHARQPREDMWGCLAWKTMGERNAWKSLPPCLLPRVFAWTMRNETQWSQDNCSAEFNEGCVWIHGSGRKMGS